MSAWWYVSATYAVAVVIIGMVSGKVLKETAKQYKPVDVAGNKFTECTTAPLDHTKPCMACHSGDDLPEGEWCRVCYRGTAVVDVALHPY